MGSLLGSVSRMPKQILDLSLTRLSSTVPWGFTLAGGRDQGITLKVGCVLQDSVADSCGLRSKDYIWKIGAEEVFGRTHAECVKMIKNCGNSIQLTVERGDHIVPSFHELSGRSNAANGIEAPRRRETGKQYYLSAMQSHGLPGKIPTSFTTVGKPFFENIQYNSPIDIYDDDTVDEMVKIMNNAPPLGSAPLVNNNQVEPLIKTDDDEAGEAVSNLGWSVRTSTKTLSKNNFNNFPSTKLPWSSDM